MTTFESKAYGVVELHDDGKITDSNGRQLRPAEVSDVREEIEEIAWGEEVHN